VVVLEVSCNVVYAMVLLPAHYRTIILIQAYISEAHIHHALDLVFHQQSCTMMQSHQTPAKRDVLATAVTSFI
jgi:hypothetical protein